MAAPTEVFATITTAQVDADSPLDVTLMGSIRANLINLNEQLIGDAATYVAAQAHTHDGVNSAPVTVHTYTSGANIFFRSTEESTIVTSTVSIPAMQVGVSWGGTIRVRFDMKMSSAVGGGAAVNGQIFRNSSAVGTFRTTTSSSYISFTEDVAGWNRNDLLQINAYATFSVGTNVVIKNLILSGGTEISQIALGVPIQGAT